VLRFVPATNTDDCFVLDKSHNSAARLAQLRPGLIIEPGISPPDKLLFYIHIFTAVLPVLGSAAGTVPTV
jgi:hypothetical protein